MQEEKSSINFLDELFQKYSVSTILNDYHHIKQKQYQSNPCKHFSDCRLFNRHKRHNIPLYKTQYSTTDTMLIYQQRLLDQIHLYLHHPFSTIDINESNTRYIDLQPIKEDISWAKNIKDPSKFLKEYFYDKYYEKDWFVIAKYQSLKDELLSNECHKIDIFLWDLIFLNASNKINYDENVRQIKTKLKEAGQEKYGIPKNNKITMNHLLAVLFYCNTDKLRNEFVRTYDDSFIEYVEQKEDPDKQLVVYYYFGKYLREIELFGGGMSEKQSTYHGFGNEWRKNVGFHVLFSRATSHTKSAKVAAYLNVNKGILVKFSGCEGKTWHFDCFMSDYDRENEILLIGGTTMASTSVISAFNACGMRIAWGTKFEPHLKRDIALLEDKIHGFMEDMDSASLKTKDTKIADEDSYFIHHRLKRLILTLLFDCDGLSIKQLFDINHLLRLIMLLCIKCISFDFEIFRHLECLFDFFHDLDANYQKKQKNGGMLYLKYKKYENQMPLYYSQHIEPTITDDQDLNKYWLHTMHDYCMSGTWLLKQNLIFFLVHRGVEAATNRICDTEKAMDVSDLINLLRPYAQFRNIVQREYFRGCIVAEFIRAVGVYLGKGGTISKVHKTKVLFCLCFELTIIFGISD